MHVSVQQQFGSQLHDEPVKRCKALMGMIAGVPNAQRWSVRDEHVEAAAEPPTQPCASFQAQGPPAHLGLGVLVGTFLVSDGPAEAADMDARNLEDPAFGAVTA